MWIDRYRPDANCECHCVRGVLGAWHWIAALDPDIGFLQKVRPPAWAEERWDLRYGNYQYFASALLVRRGVELRPVDLPASGVLEGFGSYLATAELGLVDGSSLLLSSVHTTARPAPEWGHPGYERAAIARTAVGEPWWNDVAYAAFRDLVAGRRFVLAGDWNTSRYKDETGIADPAGAEFFTRAAADGWVEVSLDVDGNEGKSWYGSPTPNPHQADHAFADPETAASVRAFAIEHWPVTALDLSDHAPLVFELNLEVQAIPFVRERPATTTVLQSATACPAMVSLVPDMATALE